MTISSPLVDLRLPTGFPLDFVGRERLVRRLNAHVPVALVVAAAGHGKSTTVAEWADHDPRPTIWVSLADTPAGTPAALARALARALDRAMPSDEPADLDGLLARLRHPTSLVLDDVDMCEAPALSVVGVLADRLPACSRLTIISRAEPSIPLGRLRARRRVVELRRGDLALTCGEVAATLRLAGVDAAPADVEPLVRRTEGWPAAVDLAARCAAEASDPAAVLRDFGGADRVFGEYVRDEVLSQLTPDELSFLVRTSMLDRLDGPLCDAVGGRPGSGRLLHDLARRTGLLVPLDRGDRWYRHHRMFGEALRAQLALEDPEVAATGHARASRWHAEAGEVDAAVVHAAAAGDAGAAGDLLFDHVASYVTAAGGTLVHRWIERFSAPSLHASPALALAAAASAWTCGELDRAEHLATVAADAIPARGGIRDDELRAAATAMRAAVARDGLGSMADDAAQAAGALPGHSPWHARCRHAEGVARHLTGDRDVAHALLEDGARRAAAGAPDVRALCLAQLALLAGEQRAGDDDVAVLAGRARAQLGGGDDARCPTESLVLAVAAESLAERGLVDEASRDARNATRLLPRLADFVPWYEAEVRIVLARVELRLSDVTAAKDHLREAERILRAVPDAPVLAAWVAAAWDRIDAFCAAAAAAPSLTPAELRVLRLLPTHLSFGEIADRLVVSANTIKTQAHAVYRKLGASSRSAAVARGRELGLVDG